MLLGGRTLFTEILGWKNPPKPISVVLDAGRAKLVNVLGVSQEISQSTAKETPTFQSVINDFSNLSEKDAQKARSFICEP